MSPHVPDCTVTGFVRGRTGAFPVLLVRLRSDELTFTVLGVGAAGVTIKGGVAIFVPPGVTVTTTDCRIFPVCLFAISAKNVPTFLYV